MTKKSFITIVLMLMTIAATGKKARVIEHPEWLLSDCGKVLTVTRVEFSDTATVVSFHSEYKPKNWIRISEASTLIGDDGKTYAIRHGIGIKPGKRFFMPESGTADFKISFEPMPAGTEYADFIEGPDGWRIWGIHERGTKLPKANDKAAADLRTTDESAFFRRGTGVVRGRFTGKSPKVICSYGYDAITHTNRPQVFDVADDGTFTAEIQVECPVMDYLYNGNDRYYFYICAGDTLEITIDDNGTVTYPEPSEHRNLLRLMSNERPQLDIDYREAKAKADSLSLAEYGEWIGDKADRLLAAADYIAERRKLSPHEAHLLRNEVLLNCGIRFLDFDSSFQTEDLMNTTNYGFLRRMPEGDLSCFSNPFAMYFFINRYEYFRPHYVKDGQGHNVALSDSCITAADMAMLGLDRPSMFQQFIWLEKSNNSIQSGPDLETVLNTMDGRRKMMTFEYAKKRLDEIREELISPKAAAYTLPEGKATDIFNAIIEKYRGKYVYVDFWGIYCGPCRSAIEHSQALRDSLATTDDIELVFITSDKQSPKKKYDEYVEKNLKGEESYRIPEDDYMRLMALFSFNGIPHYEIVTPDGRIIRDDNVSGRFHLDFKAFMSEHEKMKEKIGTQAP